MRTDDPISNSICKHVVHKPAENRAANSVSAVARFRNRPDVIAYTAIITCFAKAGQMERAYDMLKSMERSGLSPNDYTYTALIDGWAKQGDLPKAMETVSCLVSQRGFQRKMRFDVVEVSQ
jgi:pentatricopeptide repeat protein